MHFADLHDTPGRMQAKGVIRRQVDWSASRSFFFYRLRRRLAEFELAHNIAKLRGSKPSMSHRREVSADIRSWYLSQGGSEELWEDDRSVITWIDERKPQLEAYLADKRANALAARLQDSFAEVLSAGADLSDVVRRALEQLPADGRERALAAFKSL